MAWRSIIEGSTIDNVREDRRDSARVEQYRISQQAVYFNGQYLPLSCIRDASVVESSFSPAMSCGKSIPVFKIRIDYGADKPLILMLEKRKNADMMMEIIDARFNSRTCSSLLQ